METLSYNYLYPFWYEDGSLFTKTHFQHEVINVMKKILYIPDDLKLTGHSWRIGCATRLAERQCPDNWIYQYIGWAECPTAMMRYTRIDEKIKIEMMKWMVNTPVSINGLILK